MGTSDLGFGLQFQVREIVLVDASAQMSGVEFSTLYLVRQLDRARWAPIVVCPEEGDLPELSRAVGVSAAIVPCSSFKSTSSHIVGRTILNPFALIVDLIAVTSSARTLAHFLREQRPDLVVTKGLLAHFYGGLAARWTGVPCVWHVQDRVSNRAGVLLPWTLSLVGRWLARAIIADAGSIARQLERFVPRERIAVIWNGVDTDEFSPGNECGSVRAEWNVREGDLLIGSIARLTAWKGQHVLIEAFARIANQFPHARLILVGSALFDTDAYARGLQVKAFKHGVSDRVIFAGYRRDIPRVLAALDVIVHPALEKDSSPLTVVSAMAAGKAIICSNLEGTAELFDEGVDGLLVPPGDVNTLSEKLVLLLRDVDLRRKLGGAARQKAEASLSIRRFAERCEAVFERALK